MYTYHFTYLCLLFCVFAGWLTGVPRPSRRTSNRGRWVIRCLNRCLNRWVRCLHLSLLFSRCLLLSRCRLLSNTSSSRHHKETSSSLYRGSQPASRTSTTWMPRLRWTTLTPAAPSGRWWTTLHHHHALRFHRLPTCPSCGRQTSLPWAWTPPSVAVPSVTVYRTYRTAMSRRLVTAGKPLDGETPPWLTWGRPQAWVVCRPPSRSSSSSSSSSRQNGISRRYPRCWMKKTTMKIHNLCIVKDWIIIFVHMRDIITKDFIFVLIVSIDISVL